MWIKTPRTKNCFRTNHKPEAFLRLRNKLFLQKSRFQSADIKEGCAEMLNCRFNGNRTNQKFSQNK
jgi:hypothetical protein